MPFFSILWHPHQKLWNRNLSRAIRGLLPYAILNVPVIGVFVAADTLLLFLRVLTRRIQALGPLSLLARPRRADGPKILYLDIGTHREGLEMALMVRRILPELADQFRAVGFEASFDSCENVKSIFAGNESVEVIHAALCHDLPESGKIRLYHASDGLGDSLYRSGDSFEEVRAMRLSDWLHANWPSEDRAICLMRMNIEGAEFDVMRDLIESGQARRIAGFYGMWDDLSKIDPDRDRDFRTCLKDNGIKPLTFNGRDFKFPGRIACIRYDIATTLMRAERRPQGVNV